MHFHLSANAAKDMGMTEFAPFSGDHDEFCTHWYAHRVIMERRKCLIVMEAHTRYALTFCGITKPALKRFPALFADQLWRHIVSLCAVPEENFGGIIGLAADMCAEVVYHKGLNKSVQAHIKDFVLQLEWDIHRFGFPQIPGDEFGLSVRGNEVLRSRYGEKHYIRPLSEFQRLWCERLNVEPVKKDEWLGGQGEASMPSLADFLLDIPKGPDEQEGDAKFGIPLRKVEF